jgi:hypothetical protein
MANGRTFAVRESLVGTPFRHDQPTADALVAAIRKTLDALEGAAEEAEKGMLGPAKLGLLVATSCLIDAFEAVDVEFARRSGPATSSD